MKRKSLALTLALGIGTSWATDSVIVAFQPTSTQAKMMATADGKRQVRQQLMQAVSSTKMQAFSAASGFNLRDTGPVAIGGRVFKFDHDLSASEMKVAISKLKAIDGVKSVDENIRFFPNSIPMASSYQWDMFNSTTSVPSVSTKYYGDTFFSSGTNQPEAGTLGNAGESIVVAVLDTGYVPHPNFESNLVGYSSNGLSGYTFISDCRRSGPGATNGCTMATPDASAAINYAADGKDYGDWMTLSEYNTITSSYWQSACTNSDGTPAVRTSSWHGTHVTGTIIGQGSSASATDDSGVLGGAYNAQVLPVRVLGRCGGNMSDIINGMMWAAGEPVNNIDGTPVPPAAKSANVLNMSLGGTSSAGCPASYQDAVNTIAADNVSIVVAAGNDNINYDYAVPASCTGVISVGAVGPTNQLAYYSNWGDVTLSAAGGDKTYTNGQVLSTLYNSEAGYDMCPGNCFNYASYQGTSMATPHVAATVADMLSNNPSLTPLQITQALINSSTDFNTCNVSNNCVSGGRLNTVAAVAYANGTIPSLTATPNQLNTFGYGNLAAATVLITNNTSANITIANTALSGTNVSNFDITSTTCTNGLVLAPAATCSATIVAQNLIAGATYSANFTIINSAPLSNAVVVPLYAAPPAPLPATATGGCTMIANGDDYGLVMLLSGISLAYFVRRRKVNK